MTEDEISLEKWNDYMTHLYQWISDKYNLLNDPGVLYDERDYQKDFKHYEKERERIEKKLSGEDKEVTEEEGVPLLSQANFENFFGVTITPENDTLLSDPKSHTVPEEKIDSSNSDVLIDENTDNEMINYAMNREEKFVDDIDLTTIDKMEKTQYSILLIGDSTSGRTSIRRAWMGKHFIDRHLTTIGASIDNKEVTIDNIEYDIKIIDLGGQDFYKSVRSNFYRNVDAAIIVFDLANRQSFMRIDWWITEFFRSIKTLLPFILVGNKLDMKGRVVKEKEGQRVADNYSRKTLPKFRVKYLETSAKNKINIDKVFEVIIREISSYKLERERK